MSENYDREIFIAKHASSSVSGHRMMILMGHPDTMPASHRNDHLLRKVLCGQEMIAVAAHGINRRNFTQPLDDRRDGHITSMDDTIYAPECTGYCFKRKGLIRIVGVRNNTDIDRPHLSAHCSQTCSTSSLRRPICFFTAFSFSGCPDDTVKQHGAQRTIFKGHDICLCIEPPQSTQFMKIPYRIVAHLVAV